MLQTQSLSSLVYDLLKIEITHKQSHPGLIDLNTCAKTYQVHTTPVREAIERLEAEGFLKKNNNGRHYCTHFDIKVIKDIYEVYDRLINSAIIGIGRTSDEEKHHCRIIVNRYVIAFTHQNDLTVEKFVQLSGGCFINIISKLSSFQLLPIIKTIDDRLFYFRCCEASTRKNIVETMREILLLYVTEEYSAATRKLEQFSQSRLTFFPEIDRQQQLRLPVERMDFCD
jgi:DNA-binding GntR family transcriptional regulator